MFGFTSLYEQFWCFYAGQQEVLSPVSSPEGKLISKIWQNQKCISWLGKIYYKLRNSTELSSWAALSCCWGGGTFLICVERGKFSVVLNMSQPAIHRIFILNLKTKQPLKCGKSSFKVKTWFLRATSKSHILWRILDFRMGLVGLPFFPGIEDWSSCPFHLHWGQGL